MNDATTPAQAAALLRTLAFAPFRVDGRTLTAKVIEDGTRDVIILVDGKHRWAKTPNYRMVFEGGRWGSHGVDLHNSSPERIAAHWDGYKVAHTQFVERQQTEQPSKVYKPEVWAPKLGDKVFFHRGMFGMWKGTIRRIYPARGSILPGRGGPKKGELIADISCLGANGHGYMYKRIPLKSLTRNGIHPSLES